MVLGQSFILADPHLAQRKRSFTLCPDQLWRQINSVQQTCSFTLLPKQFCDLFLLPSGLPGEYVRVHTQLQELRSKLYGWTYGSPCPQAWVQEIVVIYVRLFYRGQDAQSSTLPPSSQTALSLLSQYFRSLVDEVVQETFLKFF